MKRLLWWGLLTLSASSWGGLKICQQWSQNCTDGQGNPAGSVNSGFLKILNTTGSCTAAGDYGCDLSYLRHSDINLAPGVTLKDLSGANLTCANFVPNPPAEFDLRNVQFGMSGNVGTNLTDACLAGTVISNGNFDGANLSGADLSFVTAESTNFTNAALYSAILANGNFAGAKFEGAGFSQADLSDANFEGADFTNLSEGLLVKNPKGIDINQPLDLRTAQNLSSASFNGANMTGVNLSGLDLQPLVNALSTANLTNANLSGSKNVATSSPNEAAPMYQNLLVGANLSFVDFSSQILSGNLSEAVFAGANLTNAKIHGANLDGAAFYVNRCVAGDTSCINQGANLQGADFTGSTLTNVKDLYLAQNLNKAIFNQVIASGIAFNGQLNGREANDPLLNMQGVQFQGANLSGADLSLIDLTGANFAGANLQNTNFDGSTLTNVNFNNANLTGAQYLGGLSGATFVNATLANCVVWKKGLQNDFKGAAGKCVIE